MRPEKPKVPQAVLSLFDEHSREPSCPRKHFAISHGEYAPALLLLEKGIVRYFYTTNEGKEVTRIFLKEVDILLACNFVSMHANDGKKPLSLYNVECLSDCKFRSLPWEVFAQAVKNVPEVSFYYICKLEEIYHYREHALHGSQTYRAEERYRAFLAEFQEEEQFINSRMLSTFLGISPEALSRLKKQLGP